MPEKEIGVISHFYSKLSVGIIKLSDALKVGDTIHIKGAHDDFTQTIDSMQVDHKSVTEGKKGNEVGIKVTGKVQRVEWQNPHIWFYVEGKDDVSGRTAVWGFSGAPPGMLARRGIRKDALKIGDSIKVEGFLAKDGSANASGDKVTFADGHQVFTASAEVDLPK